MKKAIIEALPLSAKTLQLMTPIECVSRPGAREHAVLFYEDPMYADLIDSWYLQNAIYRGETCIFATQGEPARIRKRLSTRGVHVDFFERENLLHICRIDNATRDRRGLSFGVEKIIDYLFTFVNKQGSTRIVSEPWVGKVATASQIKANIEVEQNVHAAFLLKDCDERYSALKDFNGSLICRYEIEGKDQLTRNWFRNHFLNHHKSIYAPREGPGFAFNSLSLS